MSDYQQRRQQVHNFLYNLDYKEKTAVETQILQVLYQIHSLRPSVGQYVFNDGSSKQLFKLEGTIPITYKSAQYNIPCEFFLPLNFPKYCPICYVRPVPGMKIKKKHMHVDSQGLIYHPYLHNWTQKPIQPNLVELIALLCSVFGKDPPLYASKNAKPPNQQYNNNQPHQYYGQHNNIMKPPAQQAIHQPVAQQPVAQQPIHQPVAVAVKAAPIVQKDDPQTILDRKLRIYLQKIYDKENHQLNDLATAQKSLENHVTTIDDIKMKQNREYNDLLRRRQNLQMKIQAMEEWLKKNENQDKIEIDNILLASDVWSDQCIKAVSDDYAITDVYLELDRGLEDGLIQLPAYLKQISKVAREQFHKKALAKVVFKKQNNLVLMNQQHR